MRRSLRSFFLIFIVIAPLLSLYGRSPIEPQEAVQDYARAQRLMRQSDWLGSAKIFEQLSGRYADSPSLDLFVFQHAKARYYLGEYNEAIAVFTHYLDRFGQNDEAPYAEFFLGNAYYRKGSINDAYSHYFNAYRKSKQDNLTRLASSSIVALLKNALSIEIDSQLFNELTDTKRCPLIKKLIPILTDRGETATANELGEICGLSVELSSRPNRRSQRGNNELEVAVVVPLSGDLQKFGEDIYNGAVIAADMTRQHDSRAISITPYDTKGDPIDAARIISDLANSNTDAVIGPLTSEEAAVTSARLYREDLPLVIPAATQAGLTLLSESSFQLSPNIELEGIRMAEYAVETLEADTAAIITSTSTDYLRITRAFSNRFTELGGTILVVQYYRARDKDFGPHIRDIKGLILGAIKDSTFFINERGDTLDIDGLPVHLDCLFMPVPASQIRLLLPQVNFYQIKTSYLGTDSWGTNSLYRLGDNVTKNAVFPSAFLGTSQSERAIRFATAYDERYGHTPQRLSALGYDAMMLIVQASPSGRHSRKRLLEQLTQIKRYNGASGVIDFGENRENIEMPLFKITNGEALPLLPSVAKDTLSQPTDSASQFNQ